jgi:membrane protein DedA with SNARE-associated domain
MSGRGFHNAGTVVLSTLMALIGIALITQAVTAHGSVIWARLLLGILFVAAGVGRLYLQARRRREAARR